MGETSFLTQIVTILVLAHAVSSSCYFPINRRASTDALLSIYLVWYILSWCLYFVLLKLCLAGADSSLWLALCRCACAYMEMAITKGINDLDFPFRVCLVHRKTIKNNFRWEKKKFTLFNVWFIGREN